MLLIRRRITQRFPFAKDSNTYSRSRAYTTTYTQSRFKKEKKKKRQKQEKQRGKSYLPWLRRAKIWIPAWSEDFRINTSTSTSLSVFLPLPFLFFSFLLCRPLSRIKAPLKLSSRVAQRLDPVRFGSAGLGCGLHFSPHWGQRGSPARAGGSSPHVPHWTAGSMASRAERERGASPSLKKKYRWLLLLPPLLFFSRYARKGSSGRECRDQTARTYLRTRAGKWWWWWGGG